jgi:hypothetical protein
MQRLSKYATTAVEGLFFLRCRCRGVILKTIAASQLVVRWVLYGRLKRNLVARVRLWREDFMCVIQWDYYSSCVKIRFQETDSEDCNRLRTLVCVCQWSVKCSHKSWVYESQIQTQSTVTLTWNNTYQLTYLWSRALLEEKPNLQLLTNFPEFYGTWRFITVFTRALHWSLSYFNII